MGRPPRRSARTKRDAPRNVQRSAQENDARAAHAAARLLLRDGLAAGDVWVFEPPSVDITTQIREAAGDASVHFATFDERKRRFASPIVLEELEPTASTAIVFLPKGKARQRLALTLSALALDDGGEVRVIGGKREGIKSARRLVEERFEGPPSVESGSHLQLIVASRPRRDRRPRDLDRTTTTVTVPGGPITCTWYPGVYGEGKLDEGTALLLDTIHASRGDRIPGARALDVGAGCGLVGAWLHRQGAAAVELVDADHLAVAAARETMQSMDARGWRAYASDVYDACEGEFDLIVSNPPFHQGIDTSYDVADELIAGASRYLAPGGRLWIVANAFLPYRERLDATFGTHHVLAETRRFRVYEAVRTF